VFRVPALAGFFLTKKPTKVGTLNVRLNMYLWRKMTENQREDALKYRQTRRFPKHSLPHFDYELETQYILTAACYEHEHIIGKTHERLSECEVSILKICNDFCSEIYAWCFLPNHYHILLKTSQMKELRKEIGFFNGRSSFKWNGEDNSRGRIVWRNCFERKIKSQRHYFASLNYVLNNPLHHGYVECWQDWIWSNAKEYLEIVGKEEAVKVWKDYPILDYGKKWDTF
jgi:putative transposase